jgi:beta-ureidopropionase
VPGPITELMQEYAKKYQMVIIVPIYEKEQAGVLYNTAAVIDADGTYLGKYRKNHIPAHLRVLGEVSSSSPATLGYPVFQTKLRPKSACTSATTGTSRKAPAALGLNGAEIVYNPERHGGRIVANTSGTWSNRRMPRPTATSWAVSTVWVPRNPGTSGKFYGQLLFRGSPGADLCPCLAMTRTNCSSPNSIWT